MNTCFGLWLAFSLVLLLGTQFKLTLGCTYCCVVFTDKSHQNSALHFLAVCGGHRKGKTLSVCHTINLGIQLSIATL